MVGGGHAATMAANSTSSSSWAATGYSIVTLVRHAFHFRLSFTQGFLAGQLSVIIIGLLVIRFVIFEDSGKKESKSQQASGGKRGNTPLPIRQMRQRKQSASTARAGSTLSGEGSKSHSAHAQGPQPDVGVVMADIMNKVHYELESHVSESLDWLSIIVAQALAGYRQDVLAGGWSAEQDVYTHNLGTQRRGEASAPGATDQSTERSARAWMEEILNARTVGRGMSFLDPIQVTHVDFGDSYPIFSNAKVRPADDMGRMRIEVDIDYSDCISLAIETKLLINVPRPRFAVLPISLGLTIERFSGTIAIELFSSTPSSILPQSQIQPSPRSRHELHFSLHPDFALDASATSLVGSRAKLQDVPKIEQILVGRVRSYIHDRFVWPKYWSLTLPNLVPRDVDAAPSSHASSLRGKGPHANGKTAGQAGVMDIVGQGDAFADSNAGTTAQHGDRRKGNAHNPFFETAPPLFPGVMYGEEGSRSSLAGDPVNGAPAASTSPVPGALPAVEAWRSHAAAHSGTLRSRPGKTGFSRSPASAGADGVQPPALAREASLGRGSHPFGAPASAL